MTKHKNRINMMGKMLDPYIRIGIVKDNADFQNMGRLSVWIPEFGGDPKDPQNWFIVRYGTMFGGASSPANRIQDSDVMEGSQTSYGWWAVPPDLENQVVLAFANGETNKGIWFACLYPQNMNHMVPGVASANPTQSIDACGAIPPVVEYNKWSAQSPIDPKRPIFTPLHEGLSNQGLYQDAERGTATSSAQRAPVSKVYGYITPRSNSIYVDDDPENEFIRLRTRSGAQILVHETTGYVYINSKNGNSWAEISDRGIEMYTRGNMGVRAEGSMNLHADASMNIEADGNLNFRAGGNMTFQSPTHINFKASGNFILEVGGTISQSAGSQLVLGAGGTLQLGSGSDIYMGAGGNIVRSASQLLDNTGGGASVNTLSAAVAEVQNLPVVNGSPPCYQQDARPTITKVFPNHEPYHNHPTKSDSGVQPLQDGETASPTDKQEVADNGNSALVAQTVDTSNFTDDDLTWMAICVYTEAAGEPDDGKAAVAQVIMSRYASNFRENALNPSWSGIKKYVLAYAAFSYFWSSNGKTRDIIKSGSGDTSYWSKAEKRGIDKYNQVKSTDSFTKIKSICEQVIGGKYAGGSGFKLLAANKSYWYANLSAIPSPGWKTEVANFPNGLTKIGHHTFYLRK